MIALKLAEQLLKLPRIYLAEYSRSARTERYLSYNNEESALPGLLSGFILKFIKLCLRYVGATLTLSVEKGEGCTREKN